MEMMVKPRRDQMKALLVTRGSAEVRKALMKKAAKVYPR